MVAMELIYVNAYEVTQHYGGPEEGGWWYDSGEVLASSPVILPDDFPRKPIDSEDMDADFDWWKRVRSLDVVDAETRRIESAFSPDFEGRREKSSAASDGAELQVSVQGRYAEVGPRCPGAWATEALDRPAGRV